MENHKRGLLEKGLFLLGRDSQEKKERFVTNLSES